MPGVANSKLIKHTHHDALRNPELAGVANGMCWLWIFYGWTVFRALSAPYAAEHIIFFFPRGFALVDAIPKKKKVKIVTNPYVFILFYVETMVDF